MVATTLDYEQEQVVTHPRSSVCVAGPGSGKTRVLTEKARRLSADGNNVLCLCFTRAAAAEMSARVPDVPTSTIHSFCCSAVGWVVPPDATTEDAYSYLLHRFLREQRLEGLYRFDWVLLDECQDLNPIEIDVALSMVGKNIFAVGDPFQSIYGFQGALGPSVMDVLRKFGCDRHHLRMNYRSCAAVVELLNGFYNRQLESVAVKDTGLTAVLCRRNDDVFEASRFLEQQNVAHRVRLSAAYGKGREYNVIGKSSLHLMTIHASKGREFDQVIIYNWLPDRIEEERRVHYVAMSRASKTCSWARNLLDLYAQVLEALP